MNFIEAIKKPFQDLKKLLIGIIVMIIPIINLIGVGYFLRTAKSSSKKITKMPEWDDPVGLFIKGLMAAVIGLIYAIPVIILVALLVGAAFVTGLAGAIQGFSVASILTAIATAGVGIIITLVVALFISIVGSCALIRYATQEEFGSAFEFREIMKISFTSEYLSAWVVSVVYSIVVTIVLSFIPYLGTAVAAFISGITMYTLLAEAYKKA